MSPQILPAKKQARQFPSLRGFNNGELRKIPPVRKPFLAFFQNQGTFLEKASKSNLLFSRSHHNVFGSSRSRKFSQRMAPTMDLGWLDWKKILSKEHFRHQRIAGFLPWVGLLNSSLMGKWMHQEFLFSAYCHKTISDFFFLPRSYFVFMLQKQDLNSPIQKSISSCLSKNPTDFWQPTLLAPFRMISRGIPGFGRTITIFPSNFHVWYWNPKNLLTLYYRESCLLLKFFKMIDHRVYQKWSFPYVSFDGFFSRKKNTNISSLGLCKLENAPWWVQAFESLSFQSPRKPIV